MLYQPPPQRANQRVRNGFIQSNKRVVNPEGVLGSTNNPIQEESRQSLKESDYNESQIEEPYEVLKQTDSGYSDAQTNPLEHQDH